MSCLVQCHGVSKRYGNKLALNDVSFEIQSGSPVALVGPNGAGKTTLLSILSGFISISQGTVDILGYQPGSPDLANHLGALPQDAQLDPALTIFSQLCMFARLQGYGSQGAKKEVGRVLELVDLADTANLKPKALSHGMNKRIAIAQALIGSPELVLLDEPTAGLDPANTVNIRQCIADLSDQTTFLISSHNLAELEKLCGSVLHLEKGMLKHDLLDEDSVTDYLGVTMSNYDSEGFLKLVSSMKGVLSVEGKHRNEFQIQYDSSVSPRLDQELLQQFEVHDWYYKQITKGKTLEEKLFTS